MKKVLHLLPRGNAGGVEQLCYDVAKFSKNENYFYFMWGGGDKADAISQICKNVVIRNFKYGHIWQEYIHLLRCIEKNNIEVIVVQIPSPVFLLYIVLMHRTTSNIKKYIYIHADPKDIFNKQMVRFILFKMASCKVDGCIAISGFVKKGLAKLFNEEKIKLIYNGTDCEKFSNCNVKKNGVIQLIFVGRLIYEKGVDTLLNALKNVQARYHLTIVGDGPERNQLEHLCNELGLKDSVEFMGSRADVPELLSNANVFIHPARWNEGFGITLIEAMAAGIPCIAFSRGAISEIITDGKDGFLIEDYGDDLLAERLNCIMDMYYNDYEHFLDVSRNAINRAWDFDIHKYVKNLDDWLNGEQCND